MKTRINKYLIELSKDEANRFLSLSDKYVWVNLHNLTANLYYVKDGIIQDVEPSGWWY